MTERIDWRDNTVDRKPARNGDEWCPTCKRYVEPVLDKEVNKFDEKNERCCQCKAVLFVTRES